MKKTRKGFTMVEFSLATAALAVLIITIAIIISNIITIYQKGLTVKAVNSVGRGFAEMITESLNAAPSVDTRSLCQNHLTGNQKTCVEDSAHRFIYQDINNTRNFVSEGASQVQLGGIFCTGKHSYVWNTFYQEDKDSGIRVVYNGGELSGFRLARIEDPNYRVCSAMVDKNYNGLLNLSNKTIDIRKMADGSTDYILPSTPETGFLSAFDLDLELYEFVMFPTSQDSVTLRTYMSGTFVLATTRGNINLTRTGDYCDIHNLEEIGASNMLDLGAEFNYCAINRFNFAARTAGK